LSHTLGEVNHNELEVDQRAIDGVRTLPLIELFFANSTFETCKRKSVEVGVFRSGGSLWAQFSEGRGRRPPITVGVSKLEWLPFRVVWKYSQCIVWFCHKTRVWQTDRETNGQTELELPRPR